MSNLTLPAELLDHIVDHLDTISALRSCCLVSKSWIPRARRHLFAKIKFDTRQKLHSWKRTFPDPSTSPACYANTLSIDCFRAVTATDAEAGGWIRGFSRVVHLEVGGYSAVNLAAFQGFSLAVKSLRVDLFTVPSSRVFDLILSLPLLEDLTVVGCGINIGGSPGGLPTVVQSSNPPTFTGSLEIDITTTGVKSILCRLLSLPGGIHFRRLTLKYIHNEDLPLTTMMVERCFHTLEFLSLACDPSGTLILDRTRTDAYFVSSQVSSDRPLESDKTQGCRFPAQNASRRMDRRDLPSNCPKGSRASANLDSPSSPLDHRCRHRQAILSLWTVAGS